MKTKIFLFILLILLLIIVCILLYKRYNKIYNQYNIYCFWTGTNEMSIQRKKCLENMRETTECQITLVTPDNLNEYILPEEPLHPAYPYLSETHKCDYLRTYFMNFYGGGYSDIKTQSGSWKESFNDLENNEEKWINGYREIKGGVGYEPLNDKYNELIGNGAYICKPRTPLTELWYREMLSYLDTKLDHLRMYPSTFPRDCAEVSGGKYPIGWIEMLGRIFHRVCYEYRDRILFTVPTPVFKDYM